ncbi:ThuA domain-containing protein [Pedobacter yulinensis]|uniref:ThuA domain-containing protein n=1 Tax=Pedobacter yulinensis TaxID=2126353 RepID=A0A2T3HGK2_9SPHI|nr:ThuA domain-containing protein [Pedobacter yulinensis]PST81565.1 ThuA domain-containing protein [Pedobacter yulinensis]
MLQTITYPALLRLLFLMALFLPQTSQAGKVKVLAFYTARNDQAHISFVAEANAWFLQAGRKYGFSYRATNDWSMLHPDTLRNYGLVMFLDTRPEEAAQRAAFRDYMERGGAWIGFHFAAFALSPSAFPENWDWYHQEFLGSGAYAGNTWRPVPATLRVEQKKHPYFKGFPATFRSSANEWYRWKNNLKQNPDIEVLLSIDPSSFPLGTGPKAHEIWHQGDYPVVWRNKKFRMLYINMGHNDIDYEHAPHNKPLSSSFASTEQNALIIRAILKRAGR